ncbi:MAG: transposase [Planctomycetaceae bacterium]
MIRIRKRSAFFEIACTCRIAFSQRSWPFVLPTALPWLLCAGQRCVSRLAALGSHPRSASAYYRFLSEGKWRLDLLWRCLFRLVVTAFGLSRATLVLDDTLCPKCGRGIFGTGTFFDHVARPRPGYIWGHNWLVLAVVVPLGPAGWVALPFWISLYRSERTCAKGEFRTESTDRRTH